VGGGGVPLSWESRRVGCPGATNDRVLCLSFVSMGVCKNGKGDICGGELICVVIHGKIGRRLRCDLYTLVFTVS